MTRRAFAERTDVPVERSKSQLEALLREAGADAIATMVEAERAAVAFRLNGRAYRFVLTLPPKSCYMTRSRTNTQAASAWEQSQRQRWRALLLVLKAKIESARADITTLEVELLPYALLPGGSTVAAEVLPRLAEAYKGGRDVPLLPGA
jgi:Zn-dependent M32 family carboxypeptidase